MNSIFIGMKKFSKEIAMYLLYATGLFCLLFYAGNFGGSFLPVMGNLFLMILEIALWILVPILLTMGKNTAAKYTMCPVISYWTISTIFSFLGDCTGIGAGAPALTTALGVFELFIACALVVIVALAVISIVKKDACYKRVSMFIFIGVLVFYLVAFSLRTAVYAKWGMAWNDYFEVIYRYLSLPFAMFFMLLHFEFTLDEMKIFKEKSVVAAPAEAPAAPAKEAAEPEAATPAEDATEEKKKTE